MYSAHVPWNVSQVPASVLVGMSPFRNITWQFPQGFLGSLYWVSCQVPRINAEDDHSSSLSPGSKGLSSAVVIELADYTLKKTKLTSHVLFIGRSPRKKLIPKAWFPYDRPDRPRRLKKNLKTTRTIIWKRYPDDRKRPGWLRRPRSLG